MWSFNVARSLVREAGLKLVPDLVFKDDPEWFVAVDSYLESRPADTRCVIKVHKLINASKNVKVIRNQRDLRDRLFSYFKFMKVSLDEKKITAAIASSLKIDSYYDRWPAGRILNIPFESIEIDSVELMRQISGFIGLPAVSERTLRNIEVQFSKEQVKKRIAHLDNRVFDRDGNVKHDADPEFILSGRGRSRAFDPDSGFQSGHVSDYRAGDWKHLWTDRQKQMVDDAIREAQRGREMHHGPRGHQ